MVIDNFKKFIHPRQTPRFYMALFFAILLNLLLLVLTVVTFGLILIYALLIVFFVWISLNVTYAMFVANSIAVSDRNYPRIKALLEQTRVELGFKKPVEVFVYQQGEFNAFFRRFFARRAIFINSDLLETGVSDDELKWLMARFVGQVQIKHRLGILNWIISLAQRLIVFNLFILPYERATAYSGDRLALATINGDISTAISVMNKLLVGRSLGYSIDPSGLIEQNRRVKGSLFGFLARLGSNLPHTLPRYVDLVGFAATAYPDKFRQFAAENPSLQPLVNSAAASSSAAAYAEDTQRSNTSVKTAGRTSTTISIDDMSGSSSVWLWASLPFIVAIFHEVLRRFMYAQGNYGIFGADSGMAWPITYLIIAAIPALITLSKYMTWGRRHASTNVLASLIGLIILTVPIYAAKVANRGGPEVLLSGEFLNVDRFSTGFDRFMQGVGHPEAMWVVLAVFVALALLKEVAFRGFVLGGMLKDGNSKVKAVVTSVGLELALLFVYFIIALFGVIYDIVFNYGNFSYVLDFLPYFALGAIYSAILGVALALMRIISGAVWPCILVSIVTAVSAIIFFA